MKNTRHFWGLSIFIVTAIVFCISTSALAIDPVMPGSKVAPQTNQQLQLQKPEIKILNPDIYMKRFTFILTGEDLDNLIAEINKIHEVFSSRSNLLNTYFGIYLSQLNECSNRPYTYQEQQAAGCLPNDTIQQCSDKLLKHCAGQYALKLKQRSDSVQHTIQELINKSTELSNKLKALSNELQQK